MVVQGLLSTNYAASTLLPAQPLQPLRRVAILLAGHASEYIINTHGGVACLFKLMLSDLEESWHTFYVVDGEFPSDADLLVYDAFVVTGSRCDAHGSDPWVLELCEVIKKAFFLRKKLLGICFGHQVISRALGGKTGRAVRGWGLGLRTVELADAMYTKPYALKLPSSVRIIKLHQDEVYELPPGAEVLASSDDTGIEMFGMGNQVLGIQGHPEFQEDIALDILNNYLRSWCAGIPEEMLDKAKSSLAQGKADSQILHQLCKSFLHYYPRDVLHSEEEKHDLSNYLGTPPCEPFGYNMMLQV